MFHPKHYASGQKLRVKVSTSSPALSQGPSHPSPTPLVLKNTPTSPVSGDTHTLVAIFFILIVVVVVNLTLAFLEGLLL
jgi:hypothetical protein